MANEFYITAGLIAIDYNDSPPAGDNIFLITAGLVANDYTPALRIYNNLMRIDKEI
jgi:hypothetical protein